MRDIETLRAWVKVMLLVTAICVTLFPVLYATLSPWYRSKLGIAMMLKSLSTALLIDYAALRAYLSPGAPTVTSLTAYLALLGLICVASLFITTTMLYLKINYKGTLMSDSSVSTARPLVSNATYDRLKWVALVALPALGALYFAVAPLWDLPKPQEVVGTIVAIDTFLGLLLNVATKNYNKSDAKFDGALHVDDQDNRLIHQLEITTPPEDLGKKDAIILKVVPTVTPFSE